MAVSDKYKSLQDLVYDEIRDGILRGDYKPNDPLNTSELSKKMNISRTPIREAINRLATLGLVTQQNHMEARVTEFHSYEIFEYYYVRSFLEGLAARNAAQKFTPEEKSMLCRLADKMEGYAKSGDTDNYLLCNSEFHFMTYSTIRTPTVRALLEQCFYITVNYQKFVPSLLASGMGMIKEHKLIAEAIANGNGEAAESYAIAHNMEFLNIQGKEDCAKLGEY